MRRGLGSAGKRRSEMRTRRAWERRGRRWISGGSEGCAGWRFLMSSSQRWERMVRGSMMILASPEMA